MAYQHLDSESAQEKPHGLSLHSACVDFEHLQCDAEELAALLRLAADSADLCPRAAQAMRAMGTLADSIASNAGQKAEAYIAAARADAGPNVAEFPARR